MDAPSQVLYGPSTFISIDGLEPVSIPPYVEDSDGDGRPDDRDSCPDLPQIETVTSFPIDGIPLNTVELLMYKFDDSYALAWKQSRNRGIIRLSRRGDVLHNVSIDETRTSYGNTLTRHSYYPIPLWVRDHYELVFLNSNGAYHREVRRKSMSHDWQLSLSETVTNTDTDDYSFFPIIWSARLFDDGYRVAAQSYTGGGRILEFGLNGEEVNFNRATASMGWNCLQALPKLGSAPSTAPSLYQCTAPYQRTIRTVRRNSEGIILETIAVSQEDTLEQGLWLHDVDFEDQVGMSVYVDKLYQAHARGIDTDGRPYTLDQVISLGLEGVNRVTVAAGKDQFGVLIVADAPGGVKGLYFVSVDHSASPTSLPLLLTPANVGINSEVMRPQLSWDGESWIAVWGDDRGGYHFSRGRFDCP